MLLHHIIITITVATLYLFFLTCLLLSSSQHLRRGGKRKENLSWTQPAAGWCQTDRRTKVWVSSRTNTHDPSPPSTTHPPGLPDWQRHPRKRWEANPTQISRLFSSLSIKQQAKRHSLAHPSLRSLRPSPKPSPRPASLILVNAARRERWRRPRGPRRRSSCSSPSRRPAVWWPTAPTTVTRPASPSRSTPTRSGHSTTPGEADP